MVDPEGVRVFARFETKLFRIHGEYSEITRKNNDLMVKLTNLTPFHASTQKVLSGEGSNCDVFF